jgi:integrase
LKITKHFISTLTPRETRYAVTKDNLELRVQPNGRITINLLYISGAHKRRIKIAFLLTNKVSHAKAKDLNEHYHHLLHKKVEQGDPVLVEAKARDRRRKAREKRMTLAKAVALYLDDFKKRRPKSASSESTHCTFISDQFPTYDPRTLEHHHLQEIVNRKAKTHPASARHIGKVLGRMWKWFYSRNLVASKEPAQDLQKPPQSVSYRFYSDDELKLLLGEGVPPAVRATAYVPLRRSEIAGLNWADFEGDRRRGGWINLFVKGGKPFRTFLTRQFMQSVLVDDGYFFRGREASSHVGSEHLSVQFRTWRDQVGVDGSNREGLHIFRSNFFTWGESQGIPDRELHAVLSHTRKGLTGVYGLYSYAKEKEDVLKRWAKHLDKLVQPAVPPRVKKEGKYRNIMESPEAFEQAQEQARKLWEQVAEKSD